MSYLWYAIREALFKLSNRGIGYSLSKCPAAEILFGMNIDMINKECVSAIVCETVSKLPKIKDLIPVLEVVITQELDL